MFKTSCRILFTCVCFGLSACWSDTYAPVVNAWHDPAAIKSRYRVQDDDTIYSIACAFEMDYRDLAQANHLSPPYHIEPGQTLTMVMNNKEPHIEESAANESKTYAAADIVQDNTQSFAEVPSSDVKTGVVIPKQKRMQKQRLLANANNAESSIKLALPEPETKKSYQQQEETVVRLPNMQTGKLFVVKSSDFDAKQTETVTTVKTNGRWLWPTVGNVVRGFNPQVSTGGNKGIDIGGEYGSPVRSVASGQIVYCGTGLPGYGNLVIIKHNTEYLTLYGYNSRLLVKEGDYVKAGKPIARMGRTNTGDSILHFEVRRYGKPINPLNYLHVKNKGLLTIR